MKDFSICKWISSLRSFLKGNTIDPMPESYTPNAMPDIATHLNYSHVPAIKPDSFKVTEDETLQSIIAKVEPTPIEISYQSDEKTALRRKALASRGQK